GRGKKEEGRRKRGRGGEWESGRVGEFPIPNSQMSTLNSQLSTLNSQLSTQSNLQLTTTCNFYITIKRYCYRLPVINYRCPPPSPKQHF
ncbi:MAG: hypothetical protein HC786_14120, partial [Richelia sp. CSU_2_1]|nr:hypothetical protein [Richelia sp. CSU_2_1]